MSASSSSTEFNLIRYIWELRDEEDVPISFRRVRLKDKRVLWFLYYGYTRIAWKVSTTNAWQIVEAAAGVHETAKKNFQRKHNQVA